jgi:hypothetical protein
LEQPLGRSAKEMTLGFPLAAAFLLPMRLVTRRPELTL